MSLCLDPQSFTQIDAPANNNTQNLEQKANKELKKIEHWMNQNKLSFNFKKPSIC